MSAAKRLIEEIRDFAQRNPDNRDSIARLVRAVVRIDLEFEGEVREKLLDEARSTFRKQIETLETAARTWESLLRLKENQRQLVEGLKRIALEQKASDEATAPRRRADGVTLH
ncbi:MAG: hypothetical protein JRG96_21360 [Deltaproteobacteria bacterium]|nr:hypothetical protein [Deltaproteobacteria bacterium]